MLLSFDLSWIAAALLEIIMLLFDTPAYGLAIAAIAIFNGIARMDFFSTNAGMMIYTDITTRIYGIIVIIMTFFFTYQLIMLVINPDGKSSASSDLIKKLITSLIMVALCAHDLPYHIAWYPVRQEYIPEHPAWPDPGFPGESDLLRGCDRDRESAEWHRRYSGWNSLHRFVHRRTRRALSEPFCAQNS